MLPNLVLWLQLVFGWLRGGRAYISVVGSMIVGGISGTAVSDIATIGPPRDQDADRVRLSGAPIARALVATCAILAPMLPPSVAMVIYAFAVGNISIGGLFIAGVVPGTLLGFGLIAMSWHKARTKLYGRITSFPKLSEILPLTIRLIPLATLPVIIVGGIISGITTPTESAAIGVVYTILIGFLFTRSFA